MINQLWYFNSYTQVNMFCIQANYICVVLLVKNLKVNVFRYRLSEISFVLKAVATLVVSLKKSPEKGNESLYYWLLLIQIKFKKLFVSVHYCMKVTLNFTHFTILQLPGVTSCYKNTCNFKVIWLIILHNIVQIVQ